MLIFPAGLVSRLQPDGSIRDLTWHKAFVAKAIEYGRDIVPVRFDALNTRRFYRAARWRKRLGIGVNLEQILLPDELVRARGSKYRIIFGKPIPAATLSASDRTAVQLADDIKDIVYSLE